MTRVEIDLTGAGKGTVKLDGTDVASEVRGLTLNANVGEEPTVILRLGGKAWAAAEAGVRVEVSDALRAALVAGGWTPPGGLAAYASEDDSTDEGDEARNCVRVWTEVDQETGQRYQWCAYHRKREPIDPDEPPTATGSSS